MHSEPNESAKVCDESQLEWLLNNNYTFTNNPRGSLLFVPSNVTDPGSPDMVNCTYIDEGITLSIPIGKMISFVVLGCIAIVGNVWVFSSLFSKRRRLSRVSFFIMHLAVADLFVVLIHVPMELIWETTFLWYGGNFLCKLLMFVRNLGLYVSAFILVSISLDRVLAITQPLSLLKAENSRCSLCGFKRSKLMVMTSWMLSAVCSAPQLFLWRTFSHHLYPWVVQCNCVLTMLNMNTESLIYNFFLFITVYATPLISIGGCYIKVLIILTRKSKEHQRNTTWKKRANGTSDDNYSPSAKLTSYHPTPTSGSNFERARVRTLKMTFIIVCVFVICWTPYFTINILAWTNEKEAEKVSYEVYKFCLAFLIANSSLNPIVYGMFASRLNQTCLRLCQWGEPHVTTIQGNGSAVRASRLDPKCQLIPMKQRKKACSDPECRGTAATGATTMTSFNRYVVSSP